MKKLVLALTAVAAFTGSASAADLGARPYAKAPVPVAPAYNWTGFYIFGGGGGGIWAADQSVQVTGRSRPRSPSISARVARGWFGTVGIGMTGSSTVLWVAGVFADGQFGSIRGTSSGPVRSV